MTRFLTAATAACIVALGLWTTPAFAQHGGHGGGGHGGGGGFHGGSGFHGGGSFHGSSFHGSSFRGGGFRGGYYGGGWGGYYGLGVGYGYPYYGYGYSYPYYDYPLERAVVPYYYGYADYPSPEAYQAPLVSGAVSSSPVRQSFYSPTEMGNQAKIRVTVPDPNARVFFDDSQTMAKGTERVFNTPPLEPDKSYTYTVRASWMQDGQEVTRTKDIKIQAGRETKVDFSTTPESVK